jgi:hypothetical protein
VGPPVSWNGTLQPDYVGGGDLTVNANLTIQIAVNSTRHFAAANLTYTAATNTWALDSHTPNEFQLATGNGIVTVRCLLTDAAAQHRNSFVGSEPRLEREDPV